MISLGALFCLMSVHFGLRARRSGRVADVWLAGLAAALMTGGQTVQSAAAAAVPHRGLAGAGATAKKWLPAVCGRGGRCGARFGRAHRGLNQTNTGCWNGDPQNLAQIQVKSLRAACLGNNLMLWQQSLMPPVLPASAENGRLAEPTPAASWRNLLAEKFPGITWDISMNCRKRKAPAWVWESLCSSCCRSAWRCSVPVGAA